MPSPPDDYERVTAASSEDFRDWLATHHQHARGVWLIYYKRSSGRASITWPEAVDEALCVGWIDSKSRTLDEHRYEQYFCPRREGSPWSRVNQNKVRELQRQGRITPAGRRVITRARKDGSWSALDEVEEGVVPPDLARAFGSDEHRAAFDRLAPSRRRNVLQWIATAKRSETRQRRISQTVEAAARGQAPQHF